MAIKLKRSTTAGNVPSSLVSGEIAINEADGKLFYRAAPSGTVTQLATGGGGGSAELVYSYATESAFPATGNSGLLYFATDTGRMYRWTGSVYVEVGPEGGAFQWAAAPATTNSAGSAGSLAYDSLYIYIATAASTWKRAALSTFGVDDYWSSVVLLLHMDGTNNSTTFTDSSSSAKTVTASGDAKISTARSQWGGASGLFDGSGDYLSSASNAAWSFGTGDFAVECWVYRTSAPSLASIMGVGYTTGGFGLAIDSSHQVCVTRPGTAIDHTFAASVPMNAWCHIAVARSGTSLRCWVDGVQKGSTASNSTNYAQGELVIGMDGDKANQGFIGSIDDLRITKGSARGYTSASIAVPTAAFPNS